MRVACAAPVHGSCASYKQFDAQIANFSGRYNVVAYDAHGCGTVRTVAMVVYNGTLARVTRVRRSPGAVRLVWSALRSNGAVAQLAATAPDDWYSYAEEEYYQDLQAVFRAHAYDHTLPRSTRHTPLS